MTEPTGLEGKVAIVTGGGSRGDGIGNGRAAAILLARRGARVVLADEVVEWAEATLTMISDEGGTATVVRTDVSSQESAEACVARTAELYGPPDILVNNVGLGGPTGNVVDVDPAEWSRCFEVNVTSMMLMAKYCVPRMRATGGGSIVNLASVAGLIGGHPSITYPVTKGAIVQFTRAMAAQHGGEGIRVNTVAPGMVYTPMVATAPNMTPEARERRKHRSLLGTEGSGWDVGEAVAFLAGERARWITGIVLPVDAGTTAGREISPDIRGSANQGSATQGRASA